MGICDLMRSNAFECRILSVQALISGSFLAACLDFVIPVDLSRRIHQPEHVVLYEVVPTLRHQVEDLHIVHCLRLIVELFGPLSALVASSPDDNPTINAPVTITIIPPLSFDG